MSEVIQARFGWHFVELLTVRVRCYVWRVATATSCAFEFVGIQGQSVPLKAAMKCGAHGCRACVWLRLPNNPGQLHDCKHVTRRGVLQSVIFSYAIPNGGLTTTAWFLIDVCKSMICNVYCRDSRYLGCGSISVAACCVSA